ncbi:MAG: rRNA cytosine-C5-methyltransferase [Bacteroidaceae bacterium]|nr:rRNA cytosine-C5-methyltransferase [Bacteroidaceae bacterium]
MELNTVFVDRTELLFGKERFARFMEALDSEPVVSIRYNALKNASDDDFEMVPWAENGRYLQKRPVFTADPLFHAGCYYVQEASSMFIEQIVKQYVDAPVRALDLCAAPGGKTTHLLSLLPQGSMLVSNEPVAQRAQVLAENVIKWGNPSAVVTRNEPADFSAFENFFDLVVVDAPCSGEGMFRKDQGAVEQWSLSNVEHCVKRQKRILTDIWPSLRPGGVVIYSTCTFNSEENEECVEWIANELGATPLSVDFGYDWGVTGALVGDLPVYRFLPGYTAGEGFFIAVLRKDGDAPLAQPRQQRFQPVASKLKAVVEGWVNNPADFNFVQQGERVVAMPREHTNAMLALQQKMRVLHCALPLADVKNNKLLPLHQLAMSNLLNKDAFCRVELECERALAYLHREALSFEQAPVGYLLLTYKGVPIGFAKNIGNRANNLYPAEWRIRKNPIEL